MAPVDHQPASVGLFWIKAFGYEFAGVEGCKVEVGLSVCEITVFFCRGKKDTSELC